MKSLYLCVFLLYVNITCSQAQKINGVGIIQLGKTEAQILNDLKVNRNEIIDGTAESADAFRKGINNSIICVKYDPAGVLAKDLESHDKFTGDNVHYLLSRSLVKCRDIVVCFFPKYDFGETPFDNFAPFPECF